MKAQEIQEALEEAEVVQDMSNAFKELREKEPRSDYTIQDYAISFIYGMSNKQRERFKKMLQSGARCGESVALSYGVDYNDLINEIKRILNVEEK